MAAAYLKTSTLAIRSPPLATFFLSLSPKVLIAVVRAFLANGQTLPVQRRQNAPIRALRHLRGGKQGKCRDDGKAMPSASISTISHSFPTFVGFSAPSDQ